MKTARHFTVTASGTRAPYIFDDVFTVRLTDNDGVVHVLTMRRDAADPTLWTSDEPNRWNGVRAVSMDGNDLSGVVIGTETAQ